MLAINSLKVKHKIMGEKLPESRIIFEDTTRDGLLTLTVWLDPVPQTTLMRLEDIEAMGTLRIYNNKSLTLQHEERVPLSYETVHGPGPSLEDAAAWTELIERFYTDYD